MPHTDEAEIRYARKILEKTRPGQSIHLVKLGPSCKLANSCMMAGLRYLRREGLATLEVRRKQEGGSMVHLHKEALPEDKRDIPVVRNRPGKKGAQANGLFKTDTTFRVKGGTYTAPELKPLMQEVAKNLGYKLVKLSSLDN